MEACYDFSTLHFFLACSISSVGSFNYGFNVCFISSSVFSTTKLFGYGFTGYSYPLLPPLVYFKVSLDNNDLSQYCGSLLFFFFFFCTPRFSLLACRITMLDHLVMDSLFALFSWFVGSVSLCLLFINFLGVYIGGLAMHGFLAYDVGLVGKDLEVLG